MTSFAQTPSLLWRHSSGTLLAGSVHLLREEGGIPGWLHTAFDEKSALVLECQFDRGDPELKRLPEGRVLKKFVLPRTFQAVLRACDTLEIPVEDICCLKPYACAFCLVEKILTANRLAFEYGADALFFGRAKAEDKPVWELEDPRTLDALLGSMNLVSQDEYLFKTASELHLAVSRALALIEAWYAADLIAFEDLQREMPQEVYQRLVVQRNELWVKSIIKGVGEAPDALLLVGSIHLAGRDSLIQMLARRGLIFERVDA